MGLGGPSSRMGLGGPSSGWASRGSSYGMDLLSPSSLIINNKILSKLPAPRLRKPRETSFLFKKILTSRSLSIS
jgi:hypothetical protein